VTSSLILHHYAISPYSQKIRAMLGYTRLEWQSVITAEAPPRPRLFPLAGGYRKIPVAQIGADIFCDSHIIAREIAAITNRNELLPENLSEEAAALAARAEGELFFACGITAVSLKLLMKMFKVFSFAGYIHFMKDRLALGKNATVPFVGIKELRRLLMLHLQGLEQQLKSDFLFGDTPNLADFSVYHGIWLLHVMGEKKFMRQYPGIIAWVERIGQFGVGKASPLDAGDAMAIARANSPRPIDPQYQTDANIGKAVIIAPTDYATDATPGVLIGSTPHSWILARKDDSVGVIHVHFPKNGFVLT